MSEMIAHLYSLLSHLSLLISSHNSHFISTSGSLIIVSMFITLFSIIKKLLIILN